MSIEGFFKVLVGRYDAPRSRGRSQAQILIAESEQQARIGQIVVLQGELADLKDSGKGGTSQAKETIQKIYTELDAHAQGYRKEPTTKKH